MENSDSSKVHQVLASRLRDIGSRSVVEKVNSMLVSFEFPFNPTPFLAVEISCTTAATQKNFPKISPLDFPPHTQHDFLGA